MNSDLILTLPDDIILALIVMVLFLIYINLKIKKLTKLIYELKSRINAESHSNAELNRRVKKLESELKKVKNDIYIEEN